jgi:hypothetical protein
VYSGDRVGCWGGLFCGNFIKGWEDAWVTSSAIVHEGAINGLDSGGAMLSRGWAVDTGAVGLCGWWEP